TQVSRHAGNSATQPPAEPQAISSERRLLSADLTSPFRQKIQERSHRRGHLTPARIVQVPFRDDRTPVPENLQHFSRLQERPRIVLEHTADPDSVEHTAHHLMRVIYSQPPL